MIGSAAWSRSVEETWTTDGAVGVALVLRDRAIDVDAYTTSAASVLTELGVRDGWVGEAYDGDPGVGVELPDGTQIRMRDSSASGGATIDIKYPGVRQPVKVHVS